MGINQWLRQVHHDKTAVHLCRQGKLEQVYIKSKCGQRISLDIIMLERLLDPLQLRHLSHITI